jgi:hypothetical protein
MSQISRSQRCLFLLCAPLMLAGCQHPLAPSFARQSPPLMNQVLVEGTPKAFFDDALPFPELVMLEETSVVNTDEGAKRKDTAPATAVQKQPDGLTGQLADSLMDVFKTFTGR